MAKCKAPVVDRTCGTPAALFSPNNSWLASNSKSLTVHIPSEKKQLFEFISTVVPAKSDSDEILCLQLFSKTLTCTLQLSKRKSIDHLCINPILWIGLIHM